MAAKVGHKAELDELEKRLDDLRRRFDMYFQGSPEQRMPPTDKQSAYGGQLRHMREDEIRQWNTQDKFRFNQIFARFVSLDRMWARTLRQIEDGTHRRDKFKVAQMKRRAAEQTTMDKTQAPASRDGLDGLDVDVGSFEEELPELVPVSRPPRAASAPPSGPTQSGAVPRPVSTPTRPAATSGDGMTDQRLQQLYNVYMQAKRRTGEQSSLTVDALKAQIEKQIPAIKAKHKCEAVDFKVVLKDGKAMLKAVPK